MESIMSYLSEPIKTYFKWKRIEALGQVARGTMGPKAGHRVYLRAVTMLEIELGIGNGRNTEVQEGYLKSVDQLMPQEEEDDDNDDE